MDYINNWLQTLPDGESNRAGLESSLRQETPERPQQYKRKRSPPAAPTGSLSLARSQAIRYKKRPRREVESASELSLDSSDSSSPTNSSGKYKRRPRRKLRPETYQAQEDEKHASRKRKEHRDREDKKCKERRSKRRKKDRPGGVPVLSFHAKNVPGDRLTLKAKEKAGWLKRGRASSPKRGQGCELGMSIRVAAHQRTKTLTVPDLTFSEMKFLEKRGQQPSDPPDAPLARKKLKKDKKAADDEEISRFFGSLRSPLKERNANNQSVPKARPAEERARLAKSFRHSSVIPGEGTDEPEEHLPTADVHSNPSATGSQYTWSESAYSRGRSRPATRSVRREPTSISVGYLKAPPKFARAKQIIVHDGSDDQNKERVREHRPKSNATPRTTSASIPCAVKPLNKKSMDTRNSAKPVASAGSESHSLMQSRAAHADTLEGKSSNNSLEEQPSSITYGLARASAAESETVMHQAHQSSDSKTRSSSPLHNLLKQCAAAVASETTTAQPLGNEHQHIRVKRARSRTSRGKSAFEQPDFQAAHIHRRSYRPTTLPPIPEEYLDEEAVVAPALDSPFNYVEIGCHDGDHLFDGDAGDRNAFVEEGYPGEVYVPEEHPLESRQLEYRHCEDPYYEMPANNDLTLHENYFEDPEHNDHQANGFFDDIVKLQDVHVADHNFVPFGAGGDQAFWRPNRLY